VYALVRRWTNHWQPVLKLIGKERDGAKVTKRYDSARTPYRRVLAAGILDEAARQRLEQDHASLKPATLRRQLDEAVRAFWRCHARAPLVLDSPQPWPSLGTIVH
jgi:hypothetical protein